MITFDDIEREAKRLPEDETNPLDCVYTDYRGKHCIVGQILINLGYKVPFANHEFAHAGIMHAELQEEFGYNFTPEAEGLIASFQFEADANRRSWGEVVDLVLTDY